MSELKSQIALLQGFSYVEYREVYLKSEADKVIADLKAQKAQAEDDCAYWKTMSRKCADDNEVMAKQRTEALKRERHQKYKRCLDNAAKYLWKRNYWRDSTPAYERQHQWENMAYKHYKRWLELAEKFKEAK